jgi:hypothetical protein
MTFIVSVPLKKHSLDESLCDEWEDLENRLNRVFLVYGNTGKVFFDEFRVEFNLEGIIVEEFLKSPEKIAVVSEKCKEFIAFERNVLNKILIDLNVKFWRSRDLGKLREWAEIGKLFYLEGESIFFTNFVIDGILDFETREEYLSFYEEILQN